jgi:hypothetical protein
VADDAQFSSTTDVRSLFDAIRSIGDSDTDCLSVTPKAALVDRETAVKELMRCVCPRFSAHPRCSGSDQSGLIFGAFHVHPGLGRP